MTNPEDDDLIVSLEKLGWHAEAELLRTIVEPLHKSLRMICETCSVELMGVVSSEDAQLQSGLFYEKHPAPKHMVHVTYPLPSKKETPL